MRRALKRYIKRTITRVVQKIVSATLRTEIFIRYHLPLPQERLASQRKLIVSLTSYPARFKTLHLTLQCLISQSIIPDQIVLWIANEHLAELPEAVLKLGKSEIQIKTCEDLKSYKKITPALSCFPDSDIVTADDDVWYWRTWLKELVTVSRQFPNQVIAHRVREIAFDGINILPYVNWRRVDSAAQPTPNLFATGSGGILYPARCLHSDAQDSKAFTELCPLGDDIWLYWMARRGGSSVCHTGNRRIIHTWPDSQAVALWKTNKTLNDEQVEAMIRRYGLPGVMVTQAFFPATSDDHS